MSSKGKVSNIEDEIRLAQEEYDRKINKTKKKGEDSTNYAEHLPMRRATNSKNALQKEYFYISNEIKDGKNVQVLK